MSDLSTPTVAVLAAAANTTAAATKKAPKLYYAMSEDAWYLTAAVVAALALLRFADWARRRLRLSRGSRSSVESSSTAILSWPRRLFASTQNLLFLTSFPPRFTSDGSRPRWLSWVWAYEMPVHELLWSVAYFVAVMVFGFYGSGGKPKPYANQHGYIAWSQIPLIIGLAGKNNVISFVTGIGYEKLNFLHRAAGRVCLVSSWIHIGGRIALGLKGKTAISQPYMIWGCFGIACLTLLTLGSLRPLRARFYEAFLMSHIVLVIGFLVAMWCHWDKFSYWIYSGIIIWSFDRLARLGRHILLNKLWLLPVTKRRLASGLDDARLEVVGDECMRLTVKRPLMKWKAGQHAYLVVPSVAGFPLEAHPFTIVNAPGDRGVNPDDGEVTFLLRVRDGFTKRLFMAAEAHRSLDEKQIGNAQTVQRLPVYVEGPYGASKTSSHHDAVSLIAGGTGITFAFSRFCQLHREMREGKARTKTLRLIWIVRSADAFEWVASLLQSHLASLSASDKNSDAESGSSSNLNVHIDVFVTRRGTSQSTSSEYGPSSSSPIRAESLNEKPSVHSSGTLTPAVSDEDIVPELGRMPAKVSSISEIDEKGAFRKTSSSLGRSEDLWSRHGVRVQIHQGRPDIEQELKTMKQTTREYAVGAPSLGIAVCGPSSLQSSVKHAVKRLRGIGSGKISAEDASDAHVEPRIEFEAETFGW